MIAAMLLSVVAIICVTALLKLEHSIGRTEVIIEVYDALQKVIDNTNPGSPEFKGRFQVIEEMEGMVNDIRS